MPLMRLPHYMQLLPALMTQQIAYSRDGVTNFSNCVLGHDTLCPTGFALENLPNPMLGYFTMSLM